MTRKNVATMEAERRELDRQIRAAKRAEAKAAKEQFLSACRSLGEWLASVVGTETPAEVARLRELLGQGDTIATLQQRLQRTDSDSMDVDSRKWAALEHGQTEPPAVDVLTDGSPDTSAPLKQAGSGATHGH